MSDSWRSMGVRDTRRVNRRVWNRYASCLRAFSHSCCLSGVSHSESRKEAIEKVEKYWLKIRRLFLPHQNNSLKDKEMQSPCLRFRDIYEYKHKVSFWCSGVILSNNEFALVPCAYSSQNKIFKLILLSVVLLLHCPPIWQLTYSLIWWTPLYSRNLNGLEPIMSWSWLVIS